MRIHQLAPAAAVALLALAGCKAEQAPDAAPSEAAAPSPEAASSAAVVNEPVPTEIPKLMHGRWGLVPADCTSKNGDNKGLITIDAKSIKFYESRAVLEKPLMGDDDGFKGTFAFTGEGQSWKLDVAFEVEGDDNEKLHRKDTGPDAMPGTLEYTRCS